MDLQVWSEEVEDVSEYLFESFNNEIETKILSGEYVKLNEHDNKLLWNARNQAVAEKKESLEEMNSKDGFVATKNYTCEQCGKEFHLASHLKTHFKIHLSEKNFHCTVCDGSFVDAASLRRHITKHTGEKPYRCDECGKTFSIPNNFKKHVRTHTGEKPYICSVCSKSFSSGSNLKTHLKSHAGERPHTCDICNKTFTLKGHLVTHYKIHFPEKTFSCHKCDRCFRVPSSLKRHLLVHDEVGSSISPQNVGVKVEDKLNATDASPLCIDSLSLSLSTHSKQADSINDDNFSNVSGNISVCKNHSDFSLLNSALPVFKKELQPCVDNEAEYPNIVDNKINSPCKKCCIDGQKISLLLSNYSNAPKIYGQCILNKSDLDNRCISGEETDATLSFKTKDGYHADEEQVTECSSSELKQQKFICSECSRQFNTSTMLEEHLRSHNTSTQFTCNLCTTTFTEASSLGRHMRKHMV